MTGTIIAFILLLLLSGFFSCAEIVMMSLSRLQVRRLVRQNRANAQQLAQLKEDPHRLLQTILIGNNLVNIGAAAIATKLAIDLFGNAGVGIATGITTFLVLLFGEIIPKSLGVNHTKRIALAITPLMRVLKTLLTPVIIVIDVIASFFTRIFGEGEKERITEEEIHDILKTSETEGQISRRERRMIENIFRFDDTSVDEIMTPRLDVFCLEMRRTVGEVTPSILEHGFTRIPIYDGRMDNIKGIVINKDLIGANPKQQLKELLKPVYFVPENKRLDTLLREFQKRKTPFGVVVDEHGLFIGIVTIEDLLEELVGEIYDEDDASVEMVRKVDGDAFIVSGKTLVDDLNTEHHFSLPLSEDYDTIGGLVIHQLGRIPKPGDEAELLGLVLRVEKVHRNRVVRVRVTKAPEGARPRRSRRP